jgi:hypothetical protein
MNICRVLMCITLISSSAWSGEGAHQTFKATDSLNPGQEANDDAKQCLSGLCWKPTDFEVTLEPAKETYEPAIVRFPSPCPTGNATIDLVALEWYAARDEKQEIIDAPAIIVVHESGSRMEVGRLIATTFRALGVHAFMIQLPTYGLRRPQPFVPQFELIGEVMKQGITDARRARDAVAVLPHIDTRSISIQGTSLGGFVTATSAGLDDGFTTVHIMLAGGNLYEVIMNGSKETKKIKEMIAEAKVPDDKVREILATIEPLRLAHRYNRQKTWIYTASRDQIVPPRHAHQLLEAAGLDKSQEMIFPADHYTGIIFVPVILSDIVKKIRDDLATREPKP